MILRTLHLPMIILRIQRLPAPLALRMNLLPSVDPMELMRKIYEWVGAENVLSMQFERQPTSTCISATTSVKTNILSCHEKIDQEIDKKTDKEIDKKCKEMNTLEKRIQVEKNKGRTHKEGEGGIQTGRTRNKQKIQPQPPEAIQMQGVGKKS